MNAKSVMTPEEKAAVLVREQKERHKGNLEDVADYVGGVARIEASTYLGLGNREYPIALTKAAIPVLKEVLKSGAHPYPSRVNGRVENLECLSALSPEDFPFRRFSWEQIWNLPYDVTEDFGYLLNVIVDCEMYLRQVKVRGLFDPISVFSSAGDPSRLTDSCFTESGSYKYYLKGTLIPIPTTPEIHADCKKVWEIYLRRRALDPMHRGEVGIKLIPEVVQVERRLMIELARRIVDLVIEPFLRGELQHTL